MSNNKDAPPFYPIIYVRGFAMSKTEREQTAADPFCGFNLGSTVYRAVPEKKEPPRKFIFESPVVRLMSEFEYRDVYEDGQDILDPAWDINAEGKPTGNKLSHRCIVIHRYYDSSSGLLGSAAVPTIEDFAKGLSRLIDRVRYLVCNNQRNNLTPQTFKCYLVGHSMGGLICRALLQNRAVDSHDVRSCVDKLFTYATPHNGIDVGGINAPAWLTVGDISNFNRDERMRSYLALDKHPKAPKDRADLLPVDDFPISRVFTMVGTNRTDYDAAAGLSRTFVGHGSDGLVRIENATVSAVDKEGNVLEESAKAFAYRSHSGFYGIVNSEEAFQNLARFLFGDVRVDVWLEIEDIRLPAKLQDVVSKSAHTVDALYQIEALASPRGKLWYLTRRVAEEDSVACVKHSEWEAKPKHYLSTIFLANAAKVNPRRDSLAYSLTLGVRVPDYEIEKRLWINEHYEGGYLFRNTIVLELTEPKEPGKPWKVCYGWQDAGVSGADTDATKEISSSDISGASIEIPIDFDSHRIGPHGTKVPSTPGMKGKLRFLISSWT